MSSERTPWRDDAQIQVADRAHNQLWRDHLLVIAQRDHARSPYQHGTLMLVRHPEDTSCTSIVGKYQQLLLQGDQTFIDMPMDRLVATWQSAAIDERSRAWLQAFALRYLDLAASASADR
jgi:hypothetical protein